MTVQIRHSSTQRTGVIASSAGKSMNWKVTFEIEGDELRTVIYVLNKLQIVFREAEQAATLGNPPSCEKAKVLLTRAAKTALCQRGLSGATTDIFV